MNSVGDKKAPQNDTISISLRFGQKDKELRTWVQSLPWGTFSFIVREAIRAYLKNDESYEIPKFMVTPMNTDERSKFIVKAFKINKKEDHDIYYFLKSIEPYNRSFEIKKILTYYLVKDGRFGMKSAFFDKRLEKEEDSNTNKRIIKPINSKSKKSMPVNQSSKISNNQEKRNNITDNTNIKGYQGELLNTLKTMTIKHKIK